SLDFLAPFEQTLQACWQELRQSVEQAVPFHLRRLAEQIRQQVGPLLQVLHDPQVEARVRRLPPLADGTTPLDLLGNLRGVVRPDTPPILDDFIAAVLPADETPWDAKHCYPFAGTKGDRYRQQFAWSMTAVDKRETFHDHFLLIRLRNQL